MHPYIVAPIIAVLFLSGCASQNAVFREGYNMHNLTPEEALALVQREVPRLPGALDVYEFDINGFRWSANLGPIVGMAVIAPTVVAGTYLLSEDLRKTTREARGTYYAFDDVFYIYRRDIRKAHHVEFYNKDNKLMRGVVLSGCTPEVVDRVIGAFYVLCPNAK